MARGSHHRGKLTSPVKIAACFLLMTLGLAGVSCQDGHQEGGNPPAGQNTNTPTPPPITEPGHSKGDKPTAAPARRITDIVDKYEATATPCDKTYQVQVELSKFGIHCDSYNLTDLSNEAQQLVDAQLNKVQCPSGGPCTLRHSFYSFWSAACKGTAATVKIKGYAICASNSSDPNSTDPGIQPPADKSKPSNKVTPAPVTMKSGENDHFNGMDEGDYITDEIAANASAGSTMACHSNSLILFTYKEKDPQLGLTPIGDYAPVINRAILRAMDLYRQYSCPSTCPKIPFVPLYTKWFVSGQYVVVEVYFQVSCP